MQRLRGWVGSDPSKTTELADALVELTAHRLLGHGYAAAADAQEAVRRAAELLAAKGPIGPYTSLSDAARFAAAAVHLATIQTGVGMSEAAGRTIESLGNATRSTRRRAAASIAAADGDLGTVVRRSGCTRLQNVATANAYADAAVGRLSESHLEEDPDGQYLAIDVDRLASDCRWAGGHLDQSIMFLPRTAKSIRQGGGRSTAPTGALESALLERLAEPLFDLYRDVADRLIAIGEVDLGLVTADVDRTAGGLTGRLGDLARVHLAAALTDLARDLTNSGRSVGGRSGGCRGRSDGAVARTCACSRHRSADKPERLRTQPVSWTPLPPAASYAATRRRWDGRSDLPLG